MTHSPQRNEVEDRGADTKRASQTRFVVSIHTTVVAAARPVCGPRRRARFIGFCYYRCNDFCSTDMARGGADSRVRSGVERSPAGGAGGRWRCVTRRPEATPRHMSHNEWVTVTSPSPNTVGLYDHPPAAQGTRDPALQLRCATVAWAARAPAWVSYGSPSSQCRILVSHPPPPPATAVSLCFS